MCKHRLEVTETDKRGRLQFFSLNVPNSFLEQNSTQLNVFIVAIAKYPENDKRENRKDGF